MTVPCQAHDIALCDVELHVGHDVMVNNMLKDLARDRSKG